MSKIEFLRVKMYDDESNLNCVITDHKHDVCTVYTEMIWFLEDRILDPILHADSIIAFIQVEQSVCTWNVDIKYHFCSQ